jgi:hypothetical protein
MWCHSKAKTASDYVTKNDSKILMDISFASLKLICPSVGTIYLEEDGNFSEGRRTVMKTRVQGVRDLTCASLSH